MLYWITSEFLISLTYMEHSSRVELTRLTISKWSTTISFRRLSDSYWKSASAASSVDKTYQRIETKRSSNTQIACLDDVFTYCLTNRICLALLINQRSVCVSSLVLPCLSFSHSYGSFLLSLSPLSLPDRCEVWPWWPSRKIIKRSKKSKVCTREFARLLVISCK